MAHQFEKDGRLKRPTPEELAAADADSVIYVLDQGTLKDGTPYWAYLAVKPSKYKEFMRKTKARQPLCLRDYGAILKYGFEKDVPASTREEMRQKYSFDEQLLGKLIARAKEEQADFLKTQESQRIADIVAMLKKKQGG